MKFKTKGTRNPNTKGAHEVSAPKASKLQRQGSLSSSAQGASYTSLGRKA